MLTVGLGAVASTLIAGVELVKRGLAEPIGSLAQLGTIRLGKRTDDRMPRIREFVPLATLDDLVFGAWDPFPDDAYVAAQRAGVLEAGRHVEAISDAYHRGARQADKQRLMRCSEASVHERVRAQSLHQLGGEPERQSGGGFRRRNEMLRTDAERDRAVGWWLRSRL